jgi:hypothetical protein
MNVTLTRLLDWSVSSEDDLAWLQNKNKFINIPKTQTA